MAEAHPVGFQWVMEAKKRGAKVIHVDPRFTRTSALADTLRADAGRLGHRVPRRRRQLHPGQRAGLPGVRAGVHQRGHDRQRGLPRHRGPGRAVLRLRPGDAHLRPGELAVRRARADAQADGDTARRAGDRRRRCSTSRTARRCRPTTERDETLQHPRCVYQILKRHFARYTPEVVEQVCGVPQDAFREVCEAWTANSGRERTTALVYSVGWTQHSVGVQYIRTGAIIQLLLGNMGRPGGGVMALRGHASIQGSTDIPTLFNLLPGYLPMPHHDAARDVRRVGRRASAIPGQKGFWANAGAYAVSLLKAYWGDARHRRRTTSASTTCPGSPATTAPTSRCSNMIDGKIKGYFLLGQNPAVGSAHGKAQRLGMANLDWLVVRDLYDDRERHVLEERPGDRDRRDRARASAAPRCSSCRPPRTWRRRAPSPRPSGCCSGGRRPSTRPATAAPSCGSSTTSAG